MFHMFDTEIATRYGVNAAVIFQNIAYWCDHSRANGTNYHDGLYWTYNSVRAFQDQFPYLGKSQISAAIQKLLDNGLIVKGNYNKLAYDRTTWYAITKEGSDLFRKPGKAFADNHALDLQKTGNGHSENQKPIPDINTDDKNNISIVGFDDFYSAYPRKVSKPAAVKAWAKLKPDETLLQTILNDISRRKRGEWAGKDMQYIPHPATYINQRRWEDDTAARVEEEVEHDLSVEEIMRRGEDCSMPEGYTPCGGW